MPDNLSPADAATAREFADALNGRSYRAAVDLIANVVNAGGTELAAQLLQALVDAGVDAVTAMASRRTVTVTQTMNDVPAGATVIGYQARGNR